MKRLFVTIYALLLFFSARTQAVTRESLSKMAIDINTGIKPSAAIVDELNEISAGYLKYNLDSSGLMAEKALAMATRLNYTAGEAKALLNLTYYYENKPDLSMGLEKGLLSTAKYETLNDRSGIAEASIEIAMLYKKIGGHNKTEEYIKQGLNYSAKGFAAAAAVSDTVNMIDALNTAGIIYRDWGKKSDVQFYYDSAFNCYIRALNLINKSTGTGEVNLAKLYNNISQVYSEYKKDYNQALNYLYKAIEDNKKHNKTGGLSYNYGNVSSIFIKIGNKEKALEYAYKMLEAVQQKNLPARLQDAYMSLSNAFEYCRLYDSALYYFKLSNSVGNSMLNIEKTAQIADMQTKYETLKKESEIALLNTSNQAKTKNIYFLLAGLIITAALAVAMVMLYQRIKKQKLQLQEQSSKLQWMMKELHHRVKNNLQIVSSLLNLQTYRMKDEASAMAFNESKLRVQAMALIHQRLYQAEDASLVNFRLFIIDLTETLMAAYGYASDDFDLQIDIQEEMLSVDAVLPLGLMVNEILTNSFKYAYCNVQRPALRIQLLHNQHELQLDVADNGPGVVSASANNNSSGFGKSLIAAFTRQLHATCNITQQDGLAYHFTIPYKSKKIA